MANLHAFTLDGIGGEALPLASFKGKAVLLVNVASQCGLTPQYQGLEALWREGRDMGLVVLGLPCNQFGEQEPGSEAQIRQFCALNYDVSFPMSAKLEVNGPGRHPLYRWLAGAGSPFPGDIRWNFEKFLVDREGELVGRFSPDVTPQDAGLRAAIAQALG
jgi:glutathione peroxidase